MQWGDSLAQFGVFRMAAFDSLDWMRFDVWAIAAAEGVVVVKREHHKACRVWLQEHGYPVTSVDFAAGVDAAVEAFGKQLRWEELFGYKLTGESRNLDSLRDGFNFFPAPHVLELMNADVALKEDPHLLMGLLAIPMNTRCTSWPSASASSQCSCSMRTAG